MWPSNGYYEHSLPLESDQVRRVYGAPQSQVSEILVVNREPQPGRTTIVLVTEALGYQDPGLGSAIDHPLTARTAGTPGSSEAAPLGPFA